MKMAENRTGREQPQRPRHSRSGFTLMEVALAILVMAIGVVATFSLVVSGLDSNMRATADTRAAIFADNVFNALRAESLRYAAESDAYGDEWVKFWKEFAVARDSRILSLTAEETWEGAKFWEAKFGGAWTEVTEDTKKGIVACSPFAYPFVTHRRIQFNNSPFRHHERGLELANHAIRYQLLVAVDPQAEPPTTSVVLLVWDGMFGSKEEDQANSFYTEYQYTGNL